ncbi:MAG: CpaF family protein [Oligoflexia bacterium]|nr:CpaF family protein [Oligoflexia bacterium]
MNNRLYAQVYSILREQPDVTEILVIAHAPVFIERAGQLSVVSQSLSDLSEVTELINEVLLETGLVADERHPQAQGTLKNGSRFQVLLPPLVTAPSICIRRSLTLAYSLEDLHRSGTFDSKALNFLKNAVQERKNILIVGGTSSGKTTLLNALLMAVPSTERVLVLEDTREISFDHSLWQSIQTRPSPDGLVPEYSLKDLVRLSMRLRPDRLVVGEVRGEEALFLLDALGTGHPGSMATLHGSTCQSALRRLEGLIMRAAPHWGLQAIRQLIFDSIQYVIAMEKKNGRRKLSEAVSISSLEEFGFTLDPLWESSELNPL